MSESDTEAPVDPLRHQDGLGCEWINMHCLDQAASGENDLRPAFFHIVIAVIASPL